MWLSLLISSSLICALFALWTAGVEAFVLCCFSIADS